MCARACGGRVPGRTLRVGCSFGNAGVCFGFRGLSGSFGFKRGGLGGLGFCDCFCGGGFGLRDGLDARFGFAQLGLAVGAMDESRMCAALHFGLGGLGATLLRLLDKRILRLEQRLAGLGQLPEFRVVAVGQQLAQLSGVAHAHIEVLQHLFAQVIVENRPSNLHALFHVARHEVGAGQVDAHVFARPEAVDAAVLEQTSHDGDDAYVVRVTRNAWD